MSDLATRIRDYYDAAADPVDAAEIFARLEVELQPTWRRLRPVWVAVAAAIFVFVAVGAAGLLGLFGGGGEIVEPTPVTTVPAPVVTTVPLTGASTLDSWQRVGAEVMQPFAGLSAMTQSERGLIAVGFDAGEEDQRPNGVIFGSEDGLTWTRLAADDPALNLGAVLIYGVAGGGPGLVAVGTGCEDTAPCAPYPTVWASVDGTSWTRSGPDPDVFGDAGAMYDAVATDDGVIVVGVIVEPISGEEFDILPTVWRSADGVVWTRVWQGDRTGLSQSSPLFPGAQAVAVAPDGLLVAVGMAENSSGVLVAAVWVSSDGQAWERIDRDAVAFDNETGDDVSMLDVTWGSNGFIAVGTVSGTEAAIWHSADARSWTRVDTAEQAFGATGTLSSVAALDSGFVAAGPHSPADQSGGPVQMWTSPDGFVWDRVLALDPGYAASIVVTDVGIAFTGGMFEADGGHAAVWAGPTFDPSTPPTDPLPSPPPTAVEEPTAGPAAVGTLAEGLSCQELASPGYSYAEAVAYWTRYERSADLDPDGNGLPCEDEYPPSDIATVFDGPEAMSIHIDSVLDDGTFLATGPAVDAGIVCPTGTSRYSTQSSPTRIGAETRREDLFTCDDGTGTFVIGTESFSEADGNWYGIWDIVSGTGDHLTLAGGGGIAAGPTAGTWSMDFTGRLTSGTGNN